MKKILPKFKGTSLALEILIGVGFSAHLNFLHHSFENFNQINGLLCQEYFFASTIISKLTTRDHILWKKIFSKNTFNLLQDSAHKIYSGLGQSGAASFGQNSIGQQQSISSKAQLVKWNNSLNLQPNLTKIILRLYPDLSSQFSMLITDYLD